MAQAVCRRPLVARIWVQCQVISYGIVVDRVAVGKVFSEYFGFSLVIIIPPVLHAHLVVYYLCYVVSASDNLIINR